MRRIPYIYIVLIVMCPFIGRAQLFTSGAQTPQQLAQNVLIGNGVTISNVQYTGTNQAIGYFDGTNSNIGLDEGIIITTGTISGADGPSGPNNSGQAGIDNSQPGYQLLTNLLTPGNESVNAAILEFDFVPTSDTIQFRFVFASEEYPEWVCSQFNDVFAFFISGPNPFGGNYSNTNMALVPGTNMPVAISNVNNGSVGSEGQLADCTPNGLTNAAYYVDNIISPPPPANTVQYDGFTVPITLTAPVICGETYHMVFAIADAVDGAFDSGIFLEANSFEAPNAYTFEVTNDSTQVNILADELIEGCSKGKITLERISTDLTDEVRIPITISGTATEGVDFENIPDTITILSGETTAIIDFNVFFDNFDEGTETIIISAPIPDPCGSNNIQSIELAITDAPYVEITIDDYNIDCPDDTVDASIGVSGGYPDYWISWDNEPFDLLDQNNSFIAAPDTTTQYTVSVYDECRGDTITDTFLITVPEFGPIVIQPINDTTTDCPYTNFSYNAIVSGGSGNYNYQWNGGGNSQAVFNTNPESTTDYILEVSDNCGNEALEEFRIIVTGDILTSNLTNDTLICPGDSMDLYVYAEGGQPGYSYYWPDLGTTEQAITVFPPRTTNYIVEIQDSCQTYTIRDTVKVEVVQPIADFAVLSNDPTQGLPINFINTTQGGNYWQWDLGNGDSSDIMHPSTVYDTAGWYNVFLYVENEIGCWDTITKPVYILPEVFFYVPNAFSPNGDGINDFFSVSTIGATKFEFLIFNSWGELIYETQDENFQWDGNYKGENVPLGVYVYQLYIEDAREEHHLKRGHIVVLK